MLMRFGFVRHRLAAVSLLVAGSLAAAWTLYPRVADAQAGMPMRNRVYTTGPFTLEDGERARIGLVLPVVPRARLSAEFMLRGKPFRLTLTPPNPINQGDSFFDVFFDITYHAMMDMPMEMDTANANNCASALIQGSYFEIHSKGTPGGGDIRCVPSDDGILTGLLLPAVRQNGMTAAPLATSNQLFNMEGETTAHSFFDVFFDVF